MHAGFPTPASRFWERDSSPAAGEVSNVVFERRSPLRVEPAASLLGRGRGAVSSPSGLRIRDRLRGWGRGGVRFLLGVPPRHRCLPPSSTGLWRSVLGWLPPVRQRRLRHARRRVRQPWCAHRQLRLPARRPFRIRRDRREEAGFARFKSRLCRAVGPAGMQ